MSLEPEIEVSDLEVQLGGVTVLGIPELRVARGEVLVLLGPNGAGKTSLIHALALLVRPAAGSVRIGGQLASRHNAVALRRRLSVVFQDPHLLDATVADNVAAGLRFRNRPRQEIRARVADELSRFGIRHLADRSARKVSGGEAARVSLARAFVLRPDVMLMDEPFAALDPPTRQELLADVQTAIRGSAITTVMSTHDFSEALRLAHRIAVMREGRIVQLDDAWTVATRPVDTFVARFVGAATFEATVSGREGPWARLGAGHATLLARSDAPTGARVVACVRPERVSIAVTSDAGVNTFEARVAAVRRMEHCSVVELDGGFPLRAHVTGPGARSPEPGATVRVRVDPGDVHIIATNAA